jgi:peptidoglycan/xylan/chitin deacetylase (PgdA/CDA1 family)
MAAEITTRMVLGALDVAVGWSALAIQRMRQAGVILLYHRVSSDSDPSYPPLRPEIFDAHCRVLRRNFNVLPLREMIGRHQTGESLGGRCAVTFDDGYRDFLTHAYPILERYEIPVTQFLVVDCLRSGRPTWNLRLRRILRQREKAVIQETEVAAPKQRLGRLSAAERYEWLDEAERAGMPSDEPAMLSSDDLGKFDRGLVQWGSHTVSHADLGGLDPGVIRTELEESRATLESLTGGPISFVSYPNDSHNKQVAAIARDSGYEAAFAVGQQVVTARSSLFQLPRFDVGAVATNIVRLEVSGALQMLRRA